MSIPLVSVIVTAYKRTQYLPEALESVLSQTYANLEIIVADDSNSLEIKKIIGSYNDRRVCYVARSERLGVALNIREAIRYANGEYISILNDDDVWEKNFIQSLLKPLLEHSELVLAFGQHTIIDANGEQDIAAANDVDLKYGRSGLASGIVNELLRRAVLENSIPLAMCAMFRRSALDLSVITKEVEGAYDYWISCQLATKGEAWFVRSLISQYRVHSQMETRRVAYDKNDCQLFIVRELLADKSFGSIHAELQGRLVGALTQCALDRLKLDRITEGRAFLLAAAKKKLSARLLLLLTLSYAPPPFRRMVILIKRLLG